MPEYVTAAITESWQRIQCQRFGGKLTEMDDAYVDDNRRKRRNEIRHGRFGVGRPILSVLIYI